MAAKKKDFTSMNTGMRVQATLEQATGKKGQQTTATPEEAAARAENLKTQGRKGCKASRINMAFTSSNYQFIKVMAMATGKTMTEFTNMVIDSYKKEHPEIVEQAQALIAAVSATLED